jgi:hypothetical protein
MSFEVPSVMANEFVSEAGGVKGLVEVNTMKPFVSTGVAVVYKFVVSSVGLVSLVE